jgi:DNA-binding PadR family transcriptional regulator
MIMDRDINILKFLNDFGFARSFVVEEVFFPDGSLRGKKQMCHRRLKLMEEEGLIKSEKEFRYGQHIYFLTTKGGEFLKSQGVDVFYVAPSIGWGKYLHNDYIQQVFLKLRKHGIKQFLSERKMRKMDAFKDSVPDLLVGLDGNRAIGIEVELESKSYASLEKKLSLNLRLGPNYRFWYLCGNQTITNKVGKVVRGLGNQEGLFKVACIENFLGETKHLLFDPYKENWR